MSTRKVKWLRLNSAIERVRLKSTTRGEKKRQDDGQKKRQDDLTPKQRLFVSEYAIDQNQTRAAIRAGFSKKSAHVNGNRLVRNASVAKAIEKSMSRHLSRADITADKVIEELGRIAFSSTDPELPKPSDKLNALTTLARHLGLLVEKHEVDTRMSILNVNVSQADLESARALVENFRSDKMIEGVVDDDNTNKPDNG